MHISACRFVQFRAGARGGAALILVLAFIVLLAILIVSMISFMRLNRMSTVGYSKSIQAQEIAQGGIQDILGDLHTEIVAGSLTNTLTFVNGSGSYARAYIPSTNYAAAPTHIGYDATAWSYDVNGGGGSGLQDCLSPTLLRVSRASQDSTITHFYPNFTNSSWFDPTLVKNLINRASASNTSTPSLNGRSISYARWNKTFLIGPTSSTNEASPYSIPGVFVATNYPTAYAPQGNVNASINPPYGPPDWVYVTRSGSRVCTTAEVTAANSLLKPNSNVTTSNTGTLGQNPPPSPIIGRYAYVVYDEGALLDVNASGFYSTTPVAQAYALTNAVNLYTVTTSPYSSVNTTQSLQGKSYLPYADLSISSLLISQANVNSFITWRNGSISSPTALKYQAAAFNYSLNNFLSYQTGDSPLLSRQDLINYFAQTSVDSNFNSSAGTPGQSRALPYLGTFSRAVSAPSWAPEFNASTLGGNNGTPSIYAYHANATNDVSVTSPFSSSSPNPNRNLPNVRFANAGSVTHYFDNASTGTYTVNVGDPLLQNRFSLSRIAWLAQAWAGQNDPGTTAPTYPSSVYPAAIRSCFGLTWGTVGAANGGNACWDYVGSPAGPSGTVVAFNGTIETLDQVAKEGREPNFFELLKAAILSGSLGQNPGECAWANGTVPPFEYRDVGDYNTYPGPEGLDIFSFDRVAPPTTPSIPAPARISDLHIMKIGANIISQFSSDSYPTPIYFNYPGMTSAYDAASTTPVTIPPIDHNEYGEPNMVFGDENLPYLEGAYLIAGTPSSTSTSNLNGWIQPQVWNPHQMPASFNAAYPLKYQLRAYGQATLAWGKEVTPTPNGEATNGATAVPPPGIMDGNYINVTCSTASATLPFYNTPTPITSTLTNITCSPTGTYSSSMTPLATMTDYSMNPFVAFWLGNDPTYVVDPDFNSGSPAGTEKTKSYLETTAGFSLGMGWLDSNGSYHPYSFMPAVAGFTYGVIGNEKNGAPADVGFTNTGSAWPAHTGDDCHYYVDCRTGRFGTLFDWDSSYFGTTMFYNSAKHGSDTGGWGAPFNTVGFFNTNFKYVTANANGSSAGNSDEDWEVNSSSPLATSGASANYYADLDGVVRPGDGYYGNSTTGDGMLLYNSTGTGADGTALGDLGGNVSHGRRPVVLNRPFRNVGELGYTFRDLPFKTLDFFSQYSADAALLDAFSTVDESQVTSTGTFNSVVAGKVNINNAPLPVLTALLNYGSKKDYDPSYDMLNSGAVKDAASVATQIALQLAIPSWNSNSGNIGTGPMASRADLVTLLGAKGTAGAIYNIVPKAYDKENKAYLEGPVRALSNVSNARTWNLMIDIIAQSGQLAPSATTLDNFVVEGERRYWLHIAIDRYTGKIVDQQLEPVYE